MTKARRSGKVFLDWSQNSGSKTTISPYSLRGREQPVRRHAGRLGRGRGGRRGPGRARAVPLRGGAGAGRGARRPVRLTPPGRCHDDRGDDVPRRGPSCRTARPAAAVLGTPLGTRPARGRAWQVLVYVVVLDRRRRDAPSVVSEGVGPALLTAIARLAGPRGRCSCCCPPCSAGYASSLTAGRDVGRRRAPWARPRGPADDLEVGDVITFRAAGSARRRRAGDPPDRGDVDGRHPGPVRRRSRPGRLARRRTPEACPKAACRRALDRLPVRDAAVLVHCASVWRRDRRSPALVLLDLGGDPATVRRVGTARPTDPAPAGPSSSGERSPRREPPAARDAAACC